MKRICLTIAAALLGAASFAQQSLRPDPVPVSPQVNPDNSVTFRLNAPNASSVQVTGDFLPAEGLEIKFGESVPNVTADMTLNADGVWEYTTVPLAPEIYCYNFLVDGLKINDPANIYSIRDVASVMNVFIIGGGRADLYKVNDVPHGTVSKVWYPSPALGTTRRMTVYTPAGYEDGDRAYPVFYLLHGSGGDEEAWMTLGRTEEILDNLIASGKAEPMIVVMTNGNPLQEAAPGESSLGYLEPRQQPINVPGTSGRFELSFPDIVGYVDSHYRTIPEKSSRAIAGLSMGGFHSMHISRYYPDMFDYVGLFSAAIFPREDSPVYDDIEGTLQVQFDRSPALYWIGIGNADFLYEANVQYRSLLDSKGYGYTYYESSEGHLWRNWRIYLTEFTPLLFRR